MKKNIVIFTDGSSRGNPGPGGFGAIIVEEDKVREIGGRENHTTNNRMELMAVIKALEFVSDPSQIKIQFDGARIVVNTDSAYVVNGITKWVYGWQKNNWKTAQDGEVLNKDLWENLVNVSKGNKVKWNLIPGHSGIPGNERCDEIATAFADNKSFKFFNGKLSDYEVDITDLKGNGIKNGSTSLTTRKIKSKKPAYSYLSLVHGVFKRHKDWASCEKEVKGIKGNIKFKKAISEEDEREIMRDWGVR
jgi:ribonuclease HI